MHMMTNDFNVSEGNNIILTSATPNYFVGGSNVSGTVTYNWDTPSYTFKYTNNDNLKKSQNWYAGYFKPHNALATTSSETDVDILYGTDKDMSTTGYFTVLPTPSTTDASPILIKCNYTLTSDDQKVRLSRLQALQLLSLQHIASGRLIHAIHTSSRFLIRQMVIQEQIQTKQVSILSPSML